jgi:hypothetical protein
MFEFARAERQSGKVDDCRFARLQQTVDRVQDFVEQRPHVAVKWIIASPRQIG